jgi:hypothetical protein
LQISRNRIARAMALAFLVLTIAVTLVALPVANAHTPPWDIPTWCYVNANNNPIGVGQSVVIVFWLNQYPFTRSGAYGDAWTFYLDITAPDGTKETQGPITSDPVGSAWINYVPSQAGKYEFVARFPGATITGLPLYPGKSLDPNAPNAVSGAAYINDTMQPSTSDPFYLTVQEEPISPWPEAPLPTEYWARPVNIMNRNWNGLLANWLSGAAQNYPLGASGGCTTGYSYAPGPDSAHILWAVPYTYGGVMDARFGDMGFQQSHYDGISFNPPIVLDGKLYVNQQWQPKEGWYCLDLYTGETLYYHNTTGPVNYALRSDASGALLQEWLSFGQILDYESPNEHGGRPYLWSTYGPGMPTGSPSSGGQRWPNNNETWMMFDAWTGDWILNMANVSTAGTNVYGKDGSILYYNVGTSMYGTRNSGGAQRLTVWNSTHAAEMNYADPNSEYPMRNYYWCWRPFLNMTMDGSLGFSVNVTISPAVSGSIYAVRQDEFIIGGTSGTNNEDGVKPGNLWCLSLKPGQEGTLLWNKTYTPPSSAGNLTMSAPTVDPEDGMFFFSETKTRTRWGYSLDTMQQVWKSEPESSFNYYGMGFTIYDGKLISTGSGMTGPENIIAYDAKTGDVVWKYVPANIGFESPYGTYPIRVSCITADGKIYTYSSEHSPTMPLWRGSMIRCINASDGAELWTINNWGSAVAADNMLVSLNYYDMQLYCFGKGPSATTVTASPEIQTIGNSVMIKGTVTDNSPGPNSKAGTPAISDDSMTAWMEYLWHQQAMPTNATGVPVTLDAVDPNGNFVHIGTVTSDASGMFKKMWTPEIPGEYTVIATFEGSKSYYASYAETAIGVSEAPASTSSATQTTIQESPMLTYVLAAVVALIVIVIAIGVLMLRRK